MRFEFATATRIVFGVGTSSEAAPAAAEMGRRVLLVTRPCCDQAAKLQEQLLKCNLQVVSFGVTQEPTVETVALGVTLGRDAACDVVIGLGGGSVIDTGKAIAALLTNGGEPIDYLEIIGHGRLLTQASAPLIAMPTTAGTGAEVTRNAVLGSTEHQVKVSLRSPLMLPRLAIVDPELTYSMPAEITASTGLDALTQVLEPFVSHAANPLTDTLCREGLRRAGRSLRRVCEDGRDVSAREDMALVSLFGGLALANAKLGAVHGIAGPFGGMLPAPHGATCAALLPHVMAVNVQLLRERQPDSTALHRYDEAAQLLTGDTSAKAAAGVAWIQDLCNTLHVPSLGSYGLREAHFADLIESSTRASSMQGNPVKLRKEDLQEILRRAQ